jgi:hypothetical protein
MLEEQYKKPKNRVENHHLPSPQSSKTVSRRDFLKVVSLLTGGATLAACSPREASLVESNWVTPTPVQLLPVTGGEGEPATGEDLGAFLALSILLTGVPDLSRDIGAAFLTALRNTPGFSPGLEQIYRQAGFSTNQWPESLEVLEAAGIFNDEQTSELANQITTAWYTGIVEGEQDPTVVTFVDSLALKTLHFTKPLTICGTYGFWAQKPASDPPPVRYWSGETSSDADGS